MKCQCANCGVINEIPNDASPSESLCWSCEQPLINVRDPKGAGDMSTAVGLMGGGMLGASIGGLPGAFVGALIGALIGREARGVG
uniref:Glycine zipper n=1 Tax=Candidatus Kentrum eta TaxID=2126337 RepID=A0A450V1A2_9GAMM|nr:MAG: hypothetical protein BECKH772A_GA0070896_101422 [Candidatus Kentron sp. H]VFJ98856.1 MAG: hypothetical protein BECKH772B_GA0070898_101452 [Candidatus Kentron sp. H]VFK03699.1 MAG: hypothetical protein BECKH772C_GA0070978_101412 [Candidatus Kentron sp. H]